MFKLCVLSHTCLKLVSDSRAKRNVFATLWDFCHLCTISQSSFPQLTCCTVDKNIHVVRDRICSENRSGEAVKLQNEVDVSCQRWCKTRRREKTQPVKQRHPPIFKTAEISCQHFYRVTDPVWGLPYVFFYIWPSGHETCCCDLLTDNTMSCVVIHVTLPTSSFISFLFFNIIFDLQLHLSCTINVHLIVNLKKTNVLHTKRR